MKSFNFPMPKAYPKNFKTIEKELVNVVESLDTYRRKHSKTLGGFFDEFENLYFSAMSTKGEHQKIQFTTLYLIWCQMMAILREEFDSRG